MTTAAIMQPTYLPWSGYFDLMDTADVFVLLDTVQFSYQSWHHRNRVPTDRGLKWLTVPVRRQGRLGAALDEVRIGEGKDFPVEHLRVLSAEYSDAPHAAALQPVVSMIESARAGMRLCDLTVPIVDSMAATLGCRTPIERASSMSATGRRSTLLVALLQEVGADRYISPPGAVDYLLEDAPVFDAAGIEIVIQQYAPKEYPQRHEPFAPYASAVDIIANMGLEALPLVRAGRSTPLEIRAAAGAEVQP